MSRLDISLFGAFTVTLDDTPATSFEADTARALLAYLALHASANTPCRRETLADLLWPDRSDTEARHNLRQALTRVRRAIGDRTASANGAEHPFLRITRQTIQFASESDYWLDVAAFDDLIAACRAHEHGDLASCDACVERLQAAVALYQGDLLAGFSVSSALFEEWLVVERERRYRQVLDALYHLTEHHIASGTYEQAQRYARRQLEMEPWQEAAHRQLMRALALDGQRGAALRQYEACSRALEQELGILPQEETVHLHQAIAEGREQTETRVRVVGRRPQDTAAHFKDREQEQAEIGRLLADPTVRLVSIVGRGGIGKTALACKVLSDLEQCCWPHTNQSISLDVIIYLSARTAGISLERLYLDCAKALDGERGEQLLATWANPQLQAREKVSRLLEALGDRQAIILLDNVDDLLDDGGCVADEELGLFFEQCLRTSQGTRLLVTSRVALTLGHEVMRHDRQVRLLVGLPVEDGVALLRDLDPNGDRGLRDAPREQLTRAVELTRGVPRALEAFAGILADDPLVSVADVLDRLYDQEDIVHALVKENYQRLGGSAQQVIAALAVFRRPVPPQAVRYLLHPFAPGIDVPGVLRRLARTSTVAVNRAAGTVTLHPIDQDYAYSQLPEQGAHEAFTRQALERRAADYYRQRYTPPETWRSIDDLEPNLLEFEHRVRAGDYDDACSVLEPIDFDYLHRWGHYARQIELWEQLLGRLTEPRLQVISLGCLGVVYRDIGQVERAVALFGEALSILERVERDEQQESVCLGNLSTAYYALGNLELAISLRERALNIAREIGDHRELCIHLGSLGRFYRVSGQIERARELFAQALAIARDRRIFAHARFEGFWLGFLGTTYRDMDQVVEAVEHYKAALSIARQVGNRRGESLQFSRLGVAYRDLGQVERAIDAQRKALSLAREIGDRPLESSALVRLGRALLAFGDLPGAILHCQEALALDVPETGYRAALALALTRLCQDDPLAGEAFGDAAARSEAMLERTADVYEPRYALATALTGQAVCDPRWSLESERGSLLTRALAAYEQALGICSAPRVVQDAICDLDAIRACGVPGLEPAFRLLGRDG